MQKLAQQTPNFTDEHIARIAEMFPHCVTETEDENGNLTKAIDFDLLKQELSGNIVEGPRERYRLEWPGKRASLVAANTPITKTLRPAREESVDFDTTQNLYIEGDNLEALKLLQKSYLGAVKMIYIDPPYNTGKDFVYKDNFARSREEELRDSGQIDEEGGRLVANLESNGRFHSDWLSMMYPRLRLARNLLREDGVIFISIDDNEVHNLRKICDEVFGEENFVGEIPRVTKKAGKSSDNFSKNNDFILIYRKSSSFFLNKFEHDDEGFRYSDEYVDKRGLYKLNQTLDYGSIQYSPSLDYEIEIEDHILRPGNVSRDEMIARRDRNPDSDFCWRWSRDLFEFGYKHGFIVLKETKNGYRVYTKTYQNAKIIKNGSNYHIIYEKRTKALTSLDFVKNEYSNDNSKKDLSKLFDEKVFEYSKPVKLLRDLIFLATLNSDQNKNDIILDFFSGSATTAHAVMQLNAEDGGKRKFIMVQLPEPTDEKSEAYKAGYRTIAEIGKERIRRAGRKIKEENADKEGIDDLDIGFRVLKIDSANMKEVYYRPDEVSREDLFATVDHIKPDRSAEDLLFGVLVDWGVDMTLPIERREVEGKSVYFVGHGDLAACFEENLDEAFIKALAQEDVLRVVFKESGFANDETKINAEQIFKQLAPGTDVRVI